MVFSLSGLKLTRLRHISTDQKEPQPPSPPRVSAQGAGAKPIGPRCVLIGTDVPGQQELQPDLLTF